MARIVFGACMSHSPLLPIVPEDWYGRAAEDRLNPALNLTDGRVMTYDELLREVGPRFAQFATPETFARQAKACQAALDRLAGEFREIRPDVLLVIGDDHGEMFSTQNRPSISICHSPVLQTRPHPTNEKTPEWVHQVCRAMAIDRVHRFAGHERFALELIVGLMDRDIDVGTVSDIPDPVQAGLGHAFGFVVERLLKGCAVPVIPIILNTYFPPNVISAARSFHIGAVIRQLIEASDHRLRVGVIASGGLSHFVTDETLDRQVIAGLYPGKEDLLRSIPRHALVSGTSEILNWILAAGVLAGRPVRWFEYQPVYRTEAGTGVGLAFASWGCQDAA